MSGEKMSAADAEAGLELPQQFLKQASVPGRRMIGLNALSNALANTIVDAVESGEYHAGDLPDLIAQGMLPNTMVLRETP